MSTKILRKQAKETKDALEAYKSSVKNKKELEKLNKIDEVLDIAHSGGGYSRLAKVRKMSEDLIDSGIRKFELSILNRELEYAKAFALDGIPLTKELKGTKSYVRISSIEINDARALLRKLGDRIEDLIITHNHPWPGSSLSFEDVILAMNHNAKRLRAVNPDGSVYELVRLGKYPLNKMDIVDFRNKIEKLAKHKYPHLSPKSRDPRILLEYQVKLADLAIEKLGDTVEYINYIN